MPHYSSSSASTRVALRTWGRANRSESGSAIVMRSMAVAGMMTSSLSVCSRIVGSLLNALRRSSAESEKE